MTQAYPDLSTKLTLPDGTTRSIPEVRAIIDDYRTIAPAVFDLYDLPNGGPHDEVLAIDLLAPNALNTWGAGQPMSAMTEAWRRRDEIADVVRPVSKSSLEDLDDAQLTLEVQKVGDALDVIDSIRGFGSTASAKLFHRLRPNLGPIWDNRVAGWYATSVKEPWVPWVKRVYDQVRAPGTLSCLLAMRAHVGRTLSVLRIWDIILWQLKG
ncbi:MAG TPA: DUF6308 family protein [Humisphaera sp.]|jgi:hypothetical protein|nr:DUF6308 family protein [Humisphaera sp.]